MMQPANTAPAGRPSTPHWPWLRALLVGIAIGSLYLLAFRAVSFFPIFHADQKGGAILMSFSFLALGPLIAGFLTVYRSSGEQPFTITQRVIAPWLPIILNLVLAINVHWEGYICAIFILPPALLFATLGGLIAGLLHRHLRKGVSTTTLSCIAALPLLLAMVETRIHQPLQIRTVDTEIRIHAPVSVVWRNIERVRAIDPSELRPSWANTIGFPRPIEASLSYEGVGGVRNASFERGLNFIETITAWEPDHRIAFTIKADTARIPSATLDEHVTVGGRFFDVLNGEYIIEHLPNGDVLLHLGSHQRLSTDFNLYAAMWSDAVMHDMQTNILHVIQHRCEAEAAAQQPQLSTTLHL
jgi:hypothetical protein